MPITAFYAALIAFMFLVLTARTIGARRAAKVEIGTARRGEEDDRELLRRVRVHANCAEYAPIAILLIGLAESLKAPSLLLHGLGVALVIGRVIHAYGLSQTPHVMSLRVGGMVLTLNVIAIAALVCLVYAAPGIF